MKQASKKKATTAGPPPRRAPQKLARQAPATETPASVETPLIVGIGASAGGLEAFTQLLTALPTDTGMAFVLVQHLEPSHESVLTRLLEKATKMGVHEVRDGIRVEPNHVYVIPANADLTLADGALRLVRRKAPAGHHLPIDHFFRSLAEAQGPRAIGVILSGTASDGTAGLSAIKLEGGVTFAQDPKTAKFDGMPRSAIGAGCVDMVLPPARIAKELVRIAKHPFLRATPIGGIPLIPATEEDWRKFFRLLRLGSGVDFSRYKQSTIKRRLARRMALHKVEDLKAYSKVLESSAEELDALFQEILIHVTEFFRDPEVFVALRDKMLPQIFLDKPAGEPLRIWVAGCSTGEEAYSIAICALEYLEDKPTTPIQIFATDISDTAIQKARVGLYPADAFAGVSKERLRRYFTPVNGHFQVNPNIREMCVFARHDVTKDPPFSKLDLISCRNVLIYFESPLQKKVLGSFHYGLKPRGFLLLGKSESLSAHPDLFTITDQKNKFFFKNTAAAVPLSVTQAPSETVKAHDRQHRPILLGPDLEKEADRLVWERYAHAGLVVNQDLQILHFRGDTSPYLRPAPGRATFQLLKMVRDELSLELRSAIQEARKSGRSIRREGLQLKQDGQVRTVHLVVRPMLVSGDRDKSFLVLFEDSGLRGDKAVKPLSARKRKQAGETELLNTQAELAKAREYVQAVLRDQDATNEELTTANEEALSSMEELQSTNEELETAKEELQSTNEELITLNEQLQNRNAELARLTDDLTNVLSGVNIPILILGKDLRIRRFTPPAEKLLRLLPGDVGRPIGDLRIGISIPDMKTFIASVIDRGEELLREVQGEEDRRWYMLSVRPFRTSEHKIEGVLMAFVDIHHLKLEQEELRKERDVNSSILDAAKDLLVMVLYVEGRIVHLNAVAEQVSGYALKDIKGKNYSLFLPPGDKPASRERFADLLRGTSLQREGYILTSDARRLLVSWSSSLATSRDTQYVVVTGHDVTEQRETERRASESAATVRALLETAAQAVLAIDEQGRIVLANVTMERMFGYSRAELIGLPVGRLLPLGSNHGHTAKIGEWFSDPAHRVMGEGRELKGLRKDGTEFPLEISLSSVDTSSGMLGVAFISDITPRKKNEDALRAYQQQLQLLTANLIASQEGGNRELARELHDVFSQELAAAGMEISALLAAPEARGPIADKLKSLGKTIARLAEEIHGTSRRLHPAILDDLGLEAALREECRSFEQQSDIPAEFLAQDVPSPLPKDVALCLYRVAQESLRNIRKHSQATEVQLRLTGEPAETGAQRVLLEVQDTGDGFELDQVLRKGGLGLISMEERVRLVGGQLTVQSQPGVGTTVTASVPLNTGKL